MFKNWTWKQWTAFAIIIAFIIAAVVCHLVQPQVSYAWLEMVSIGCFVVGGITGYLLKKNNIVSKKQILND